MLRDDSFSSKAKVDRYGRKLPSDTGRRQLEKFYRIDDDEDVERELERVNGPSNAKAQSAFKDQQEDTASSSSSSSSEDDSDEESESDEEEEEVFGVIEEEGAEGGEIPKGEVTSRLAVVNLDWDNIRASDLMAVFSSFLPGNGQLQKVTVYPSQFGKERMEQEETEGPPKEIFAQSSRSEKEPTENNLQDDSDFSGLDDQGHDESEQDEVDDDRIKKAMLKEDSGIDFDSAKLRRYQLERLRYYYAVLDCSSTAVAQAVYDAVDGTEYLSTANFFDLRYIPDDTDFSEDKPRDECTRIPDGYRPNEFVTDALQHSKVKLTWDADDGARKEAQKRAFARSRKDINEDDLKVYLGSDSSDDDEDDATGEVNAALEPVIVDATSENNPVDKVIPDADTALTKPLSKKAAERQRMRALLGLDPDPAPRKSRKARDEDGAPVVGDMQITFTSGFSTTADGQQTQSGGSVFENAPEPEETTAEKYVRRERERKARRREKAKVKRAGGDNNGDTVVDSTGIKDSPVVDKDTNRKGGEEKEADPTLTGFDDPFFASDPDNQPSKTSKTISKSNLKSQPLHHRRTSASDSDTHPKPNTNTNPNDKKNKKRNKSKSKRKNHPPSPSPPPTPTQSSAQAASAHSFTLNPTDARFTAVHDSADYAIDPSHPRYQDTAGMRALLAERARRRGRELDPEFMPEQSALVLVSGGRGKDKKRARAMEMGVDDGMEVEGNGEEKRKTKKRRKEGKVERRGMGKR